MGSQISAPAPVDEPDQLLRLDKVAEILDVSRDTVDRLIRRGTLAAVRLGGNRRVKSSTLQAFIAQLDA